MPQAQVKAVAPSELAAWRALTMILACTCMALLLDAHRANVRLAEYGSGDVMSSSRQLAEHNSGMMLATLQVATLQPNGTLALPETTTDVFIEVGTNSRNLYDGTGRFKSTPGGFLLSFEPILDKWAWLLARHSRPDRKTKLGHHLPNGMAFPYAIAESDGFAHFHMDGSIDGWPISFLKVDAQGFDLGVLESAGAHMSRVRELQLELTNDHCPRMYRGALTCSETVARMAAHGFRSTQNCTEKKNFNGARGCEGNFWFHQVARQAPI